MSRLTCCFGGRASYIMGLFSGSLLKRRLVFLVEIEAVEISDEELWAVLRVHGPKSDLRMGPFWGLRGG